MGEEGKGRPPTHVVFSGWHLDRRSHKEETSTLKARIVELNKDAKGASMGQRSGQKELDNLRKELEKSRKKCQDAEGRLRAAVQEKASAVSEKANLERELKREKSKGDAAAEKLGKREEVEERKRGALQAEANKARDDAKEAREELAKERSALGRALEEGKGAEAARAAAEAELAEARAAASGLEEELGVARKATEESRAEAESLRAKVRSDTLWLFWITLSSRYLKGCTTPGDSSDCPPLSSCLLTCCCVQVSEAEEKAAELSSAKDGLEEQAQAAKAREEELRSTEQELRAQVWALCFPLHPFSLPRE